MTQMCTYFKTKTNVAQNLIDNFFSNFDCHRTFPYGRFQVKKKYGSTGLISEKTEVLYVEFNERAEAATSSYSAPGDFLLYNYSVLVAKNQKKIRLRCLVHEFSFTDINHG